MADKELRRMNRTELIEIIYALQQNEKTLREENEKLRLQLNDKIVRLEESGSIAEAALSLNHIFEDAQEAAQQYLDSVRIEKAEMIRKEAEAKEKADRIERDAREKARQVEEEARKEADRILAEAREKAGKV